MKIKDAISNTRALSGNAVDDNTLCRWLSELDGRLMLDFYKGSEWMSYSLPQDEDHELLVPFPWDELYVHYLEAMVYYSNGEFDRYRNSYEMFNKKELDYRQWYARNQLPITLEALARRDCTVVTEGRGSKPFWYLSAYALAVKHGYTGTEEEWLAELVGPQGRKGEKGDRGEKGDTGPQGPAGPTGPAGGVDSFNGRTGAVMPAAGDYTAAMVGAAPEGYGLGTNAPRAPAGDDGLANPDLITQTGFYYAVKNLFPGGGNLWGTVLHINTTSTSATQFAIVELYTSIGIRLKTDGIWGPWEWINPLLDVGVEYRTVERYRDKPVYVKLVNFGNLTAGSVKTVSFDSSGTLQSIVEARGELLASSQSWQIPTMLYGGNYADTSPLVIAARVNSGNGMIYGYANDSAANISTAYIVVKYTKNTD